MVRKMREGRERDPSAVAYPSEPWGADGAVWTSCSLIIPTLNEERRLGSLLDSLPADARARLGLEVIVSDGRSTDGTLEVAAAAADRVVVHEGPGRQTIAAGRNAGARVARGRVLVFMNADVSVPGDAEAFLGAVEAAARHYGAATCRVEIEPELARRADRLVIGACNALFWAMNRIGVGMGRGECQAVRSDVFEAVGGYRADLVAGEDFDFFHRVTRHLRETGEGRVRFLWDRVVYEDPRRYRKMGYPATMWLWFRNFLSVLVRGRSVSEAWEPVR